MIIKKNCEYCQKEFEFKPSARRKFCSVECRAKSQIGKPAWNKGLPKEEQPRYGKYLKVQKNCLQCKKEFEVSPHHNDKKFCSNECRLKAQIGKKRPEVGKKISLALKGRKLGFIPKGAYKKGRKNPNKNRTYEEIYGKEKAGELKKKISDLQSKKWQDLRHRKRMSEAHKGHIPSNKKEKIKKECLTCKKEFFGPPSSICRKFCSRKCFIEFRKGRHYSLETEFHGGLIPWNKGKTGIYSEETIKKIKLARLKQIIPTKDTKPECLLQQALKRQNILFQTHYSTIGQPDIAIFNNGSKVAIFADGCWWHGCERCLKKDKMTEWMEYRRIFDMNITQQLQQQEWVVLRFWEHEIKNNLDTCLNKIKAVLI